MSDHYITEISPFSECIHINTGLTCGSESATYRTSTARCFDTKTSEYVPVLQCFERDCDLPDNVAPLLRGQRGHVVPIVEYGTCSTATCTPAHVWVPEAWGACQADCWDKAKSDLPPVKTRAVRCRQVQADGKMVYAEPSACTKAGLQQPETTRRCNSRECGRTPCLVRTFVSKLSPACREMINSLSRRSLFHNGLMLCDCRHSKTVCFVVSDILLCAVHALERL
jgi:hypothetical protein